MNTTEDPQNTPSFDACDSLLESLLYICAEEGREATRASLTAGLPLVDGRITPELFVRAAQRVNIESKINKRALLDISSLSMPIVLLLNNDEAVVFERLPKVGDVRVFDPKENKTKHMSLKALDQQYSGFCILTKAMENIDARIDITPKNVDVHWFWHTIMKSWRIYRDVLIASFMINIFVLANPLFVMNVYDRVVPNNAIETLWGLSIGVLILFGFDFLLRMLRTYFLEIAGKKSDVLLSTFIMERVLGTHYSQHPKSVGAFASRVREFETIRNFITSTAISAFIDLPFVILFLVVIAYIGGPIVWVPIFTIPIILIYSWAIQHKLKRLVSLTFLATAQKNATLVEALTNLETLKGMGAESKILRKWESAISTLAYWGVRWRFFSASASTFSAGVMQVSAVFVVIVGVYSIAENELTQGALIACVILVGRALAPLAQISGLLVQYQQSKLALESLEEIVSGEQERPEGRKFIERLNFKGAIEFKDVSFVYPGETHEVLSGLSFKIKPGEKVGVIGRIGSGKSTVEKLLVGLYRPSKGAVLIDGIDITQIDPAELREHIGYVPQDSVLFYGDIRDNIAYRHQVIADEEILRVAKVSGVSDFVDQHPKGFERMIGERGESLSGGQRQAINVARGLVNSPPIIIFDEPSTAMDNASENKMVAQLKSELSGKTAIIVTHKTTMLTLVDRVIVVDGGKAVADGPKDKVLEALQKGQIRVD